MVDNICDVIAERANNNKEKNEEIKKLNNDLTEVKRKEEEKTKEMHEKSEKELQANAKNHADIVNIFINLYRKAN